MLEVKNLVKHFPGVQAVNGVEFSIHPGVCFGLLGPNGAGKTTTIEIMEGIQKPTAGEVLYKGEPIGSRFKEEAGIQFQTTALQEFLTVKETLKMFHGLYKRSADFDALIDMCQLRDLLARDTRKLSGGQRQRLLLAIALVNDPEVIILDEPTTGLDPHARRVFWSLIDTIKQRNKTVLLTTHYMEEAYHLCDEIAIMEKGKIIAQGSPAQLLKAHFDDTVISIPAEDFKVPVETYAEEAYLHHESVTIRTNNVQKSIQLLLDNDIPLSRLEIRARTLDDLFIELTENDLQS
ncbi:MAG: ABC transporter ATP-binding protein [Gammaproteobacteria bacterium SG8_11]|nr:MAG: ABC transporter ATP-binding protein [Gammaproteobacteria bacterium SG8_11]